jgi:glycosyltransferase involved in cell wall biosynthesis
MKLCLNMIVKNEAARIERALKSYMPYIESAMVIDTGSVDDTKEVIARTFADAGKPFAIKDAPFETWSQARNVALDEGRRLAKLHGYDALLLADADMELVVTDAVTFRNFTTPTSLDMYQDGGGISYLNRRIVSVNTTGYYRGATHEYLDIEASAQVPHDVAYFIDHADGSNRPDKYKRDIRLLLDDLKKDPDNGRTFYYLAQSYRDAGQLDKAIKWYKRRVEVGGWDEEVWHAQYCHALCLRDMGNEEGFIRESLVAYNMRPTRVEPMWEVATYFRKKGMNPPALAFAEAIAHVPMSKDGLFVNTYMHEVGAKEEISIAGFYVPGKRLTAFKAASELSMKTGNYGGTRELARCNLYHYIQPLAEWCPSFKSQKIAFDAPEGWVAMNPSVTNHLGDLYCNVRCVNYHIDQDGRYIIKATDGTANAENPIKTRNFTMYLGGNPFLKGLYCEIVPPPDLPCEFNLVMGFEDIRLFSWGGNLWTSATVRQLHPDGNCEQVISQLESWYAPRHDLQTLQQKNIKRILREPRQTEKNWAPFVDYQELLFMYRPGVVVDTDGRTIREYPTGTTVDHISGSSQLIPWDDGWLAIVHEARGLPEAPWKRYYYHRFAQYDRLGKLIKFSLPFVFQDRVIEFCAGMAYHSGILIISYGYKDEEARIAIVDADEVRKFLDV